MTPDLARLRQVKSFEGPLEFYYPGQPDMTLVAGSVNVMGPLGSQGQGKEEATITGDGELIGLREKITGKSHISRENLWFPVDFPLSQPIEMENYHE